MTRVQPNARVTHLVVARESNTRDIPLLEGMILQTLERNQHLPGVRRLVELGVRPVSHPEEVGGERLNSRDTKAVLFSVEGTACLYSRGSAAKDDNLERENGFVDILCQVIDRHQPEHIYVATFSRLVRSFYQASPVQNAVERAGSTVHYSEGPPINFAEPEGPMRWAMMAAFADMERYSVVSRLMLGRVGKHRQGKWISGSYGIPMGYTLDADERVIIDLDAKAAVHKAIRLMGDPEISNSELALGLGAIGVTPPARAGRTNWQYSDWTWDGVPYVPRAQRPPGEATHLWPEVRAHVRGAQARTLSEYSAPDVAGRRIVNMLEVWRTGEFVYPVRNPLPNVRNFAEYEVELNDAGEKEVRFKYTPGLPEDGWASSEELALARTVRAQRTAVEAERAHSLERQLPLLGTLGRWNEDGRRYGLLSGRNSNRPSYVVRYMDLPDVVPLDSEGHPIYGGFMQGNVEQGTRIAMMDAAEMHRALATALIQAIENNVEVRPHAVWPPSRMAAVSEDSLALLRQNKAALEGRAARARQVLLDTHASPEMQAKLMADAEELLSKALDIQAQLDAASTNAGVAFPDALSVRPRQLARALAVLGSLDGQAPRRITQLVNTVLSDLRIRPDGTDLHCSVEALLDVEDGLVVLGPVRFTVAQRLASRARRIDRRGATDDLDGDELQHQQSVAQRKADVAGAMMTTNKTVAELATLTAGRGSKEFKNASDHLVANGMTRLWANTALRVSPLVTRQTIWHHVCGGPLPPGLDPLFVERVRATFLGQDRRVHLWWKRTGYRQEFLTWLRHNERTVTVEGVRRWLARRTSAPTAYLNLTKASDETGVRRSEPIMWPVVRAPKRGDRIPCRRDCPSGCREHRIVRMSRCPHPDCLGDLDHHIPVQEIPTGLLCGTCLREPVDNSPVFPAYYLSLTEQAARDRIEAVNPSLARAAQVSQATRTMRDAARRWAIAEGLHDGSAKLVTLEQVDAYLKAVADGLVQDSTAIRQWAREADLVINERGRIPEQIVTAYRRDLAVRVPQTAREWARSMGMMVPRNSELTEDIVEAFAAHRALGATERTSETHQNR